MERYREKVDILPAVRDIHSEGLGLVARPQAARGRRRRLPEYLVVAVALAAAWTIAVTVWLPQGQRGNHHRVPQQASAVLALCRSLDVKPAPPPSFANRSRSDRFQIGTKPVHIRNARIWTGGLHGAEVVKGDILLANGLIAAVGSVSASALQGHAFEDLTTFDANGAWVTPGIVDLHSHLAAGSSPALQGASDTNSFKGLALPWLRSLDAINTHDDAFRLAIAGGVTTSLILPGSADAIGGQAFVIKLRPTVERTTTSLLLEPFLSDTLVSPPRWRHMKHACGENPSRVYSGTRMDTAWAYRQAYEHARKIKVSQDEYCAKAFAGQWEGLGAFPEDLQWEALVDVLRGRVKVQTHCYEAVDIDGFVRLSNEFQFPVAAFHHAHEAYLVPEVLKHAYESPPAIAMFATFSRYKREAFRHSEFAPRLLAKNGIKVVMKSDHPGIISRHLLHEAQQAHYYGLPEHVALSSVLSTPAEVLGLDHRVGFIKEGYDADLVIWDSHPLTLGATPMQVFVDGIAQFETAYATQKPSALQETPETPDFDQEATDAVSYEGLPPLTAKKAILAGTVVFRNVSEIWMRNKDAVREVFSSHGGSGIAVSQNGKLVCTGQDGACSAYTDVPGAEVIDLEGGSISPALVSYGSLLGLQEINDELSTSDGFVSDVLSTPAPGLFHGNPVIKAVDGLQYETRDALLAYRAGVTSSITAPQGVGFLVGLSTALSTGAPHKLATGAVVQDVVALHVSIHHVGSPSVSTQIAALRNMLLNPAEDELGKWSRKVAEGSITLVIDVSNADIMATLLLLKKEVEHAKNVKIRMTFGTATEAHLLADEIAAADVGVIVTPRPFPYVWEEKRILAGPPLTKEGTVAYLLAHNVTVGIGPQGIMGEASMSDWAVRNLRFDAGWIMRESDGRVSKADAFAIASSNIHKLLGVDIDPEETDLVATRGGDLLSFSSKVVAIFSPQRGVVDIL